MPADLERVRTELRGLFAEQIADNAREIVELRLAMARIETKMLLIGFVAGSTFVSILGVIVKLLFFGPH